MIVLFSACKREDSSAIDQDRIYTEYRVSYNEIEDETTATAIFRIDDANGTKLELTDNAQAVFNNQVMNYKNLDGSHQLVLDGFIPDGTFEYVNNDGVSFINEVPFIDPVGFFSNVNTTLTRGQDRIFLWTGNPVALNECVKTTVPDDQLLCFEASTSVVLHGEAIAEINEDQKEIALIRERESVINASPIGGIEGGKITTEFFSFSVIFDIED